MRVERAFVVEEPIGDFHLRDIRISPLGYQGHLHHRDHEKVFSGGNQPMDMLVAHKHVHPLAQSLHMFGGGRGVCFEDE